MSDEATPTIIRCSSMDSLFACTPSVLGDGVRIGTSHPASDLGKAVHSMAAELVEHGAYHLDAACQQHGLSEDQQEEAERLMRYCVTAWEDLRQHFPRPRTECVVQSKKLTDKNGQEFYITGTCDVLSPVGSSDAIFLDWKTGYVDDGYHQQMNAYAYNIWCELGKPANVTITGVCVFLRHFYQRVVKWDANKLKEWERDLTYNVLPSTQYTTGVNCKFCTLSANCAARKKVVGSTLDALMFGDSSPDNAWLANARRILEHLTPDNKDHPDVATTIQQLKFRMDLAGQAIDEAKAMLREAVERVGSIPMGGNAELALREIEYKGVNPARAMPVARQYLSDHQITDAMRLSLTKLVNVYVNRQKHGKRAEARKEFMEALERSGAIEMTVRKRLEVTDVTEPEQQETSDERTRSESTGGVGRSEGASTGSGSGGTQCEVDGSGDGGGTPSEAMPPHGDHA